MKVTVGKSQTLYSSLTKRGKDKNSGLLSIGPVNIDIPQHPVALHGVMTRSSKQLSSTLQELRVGRGSARSTKHTEEPDTPYNTRDQKEKVQIRKAPPPLKTMPSQNGLLQPLVMQFNILLQSLSINAALLPSLQAQYRMNHVSSTGVTGNRAKFVIDLPTHTLSFTTKIQNTDLNLPSEACISLPQVHVQAEYIPDNRQEDLIQEGIVLRQGGYLNASAEIGEFEKCLTTDLLNHLVFVQKVFMKEVNEVVQKVYGGEKPVPLWSEDSDDQESSLKRILFSLNISMKRIQLTATTPCSSAVRFETGALELHLSNRVKNVGEGNDKKLFFKSHIDFNLALGQIIKNIIFDEAEPEFQQYAFFHTTIGLRNAFQDELSNEDKELILLKLKRPLLYIQPIAVDKAILVWLNYKNAYEYWAEKRANLNPNSNNHSAAPYQFGQLASSNLSTLFLQLTVEDMGICLPLNTVSCPSTWGTRSYQEFEPKGAVVITLENTIISACNSGSLVSMGRFSGLCLRFADDFETTLDDWKPNMGDSNIMNLCVVSEGTYEVCSRTVAAKKNENAKWLLNVKWQMEGVDIHLDVNIGKQLSSLGHTLTMLTGYEDDEQTGIESPDSDDGDFSSKETNPRKKEFENVPAFVFDPTIDSKKRSLMMEKEMTEQLKIINDLRTLGASQNTIIHEEKRLQELQAICYKYFRKDMMQKFKRPSIRRAMLKSTNRSSSFMGVTYEEPTLGRLDPIASNDEISSLCSTPGPSRSASMKASGAHRVHLNESMRQTSLPNQDLDSELTENDSIDWAGYDEGSPPQIQIDGTSVEMRRKSNSYPPLQKEPNIDFELDIKVLVNSGKCVLHTKEPEERLLMQANAANKTHKRERSFGTVNEWGSPTPSRRQRDRSKLRYAHASSAVLVDLTIFHIPGLDVKLQYQSKTLLEDVLQRPSSHVDSGNSRKFFGSKRAALFAWMTLQSVPEETIISPHILEFLEQALEPIPTKPSYPQMTPVSNANVNLDILPANYVTYASFPVDVIVYFHMQPSTFRFSCLPISRVECMLQLPSLDIVFSSKRPHEEEPKEESNSKDKDKIPNGGLSVTGCLADFNVYIFHPYGGKKSGIKEAQFSPLTDSERKDSLSINVEFVKFHITRSRKLYIEPGPKKGHELSKAVIRFSTIVDIGSASFKYDMRRLTEILAFPKAWYKKRIMRRLFLGDLSMNNIGVNSEMDMSNVEGRTSGDHFMNFDFESGNPRIDKLKLIGKSASEESSNTPSEQNQVSAWETLVLFGVNFTKLSVQMNMGNVMGNVVWLTKDFQSDGRLSIGSTGTKNMNIGIYLGGSSLDAKGGIVGGSFEVNKINTRFHIKEELGMEPCHTVGLSFMALELRLDYMGTSVLMTRISSFSAALKDEWKTNPQMINAMIFIHGDLSWDQLQIMISKSTTADILKMYFKLEEFFTQQFKSSKRVFTNLDPQLHGRTASARRRLNSKGEKTPVDMTNTDARHHRHWQKPLDQAKSLVVPTLVTRLPMSGNILGGTAELHGNNISLACFHGINFKSKSWALFSLRSPCINFATEAKQLSDSTDIHVIETLTFSLGQQNAQTPQSHSMAIVSRISRNIRNYPPQFKTLNEWFHYAFANSEIDGEF